MYTEYYESEPIYTYSNSQVPSTYSYNYSQTDGDRNFIAPFILGGITGGLLAPAFYRPYPYYNPYYRPFYGPGFYRPPFYRW